MGLHTENGGLTELSSKLISAIESSDEDKISSLLQGHKFQIDINILLFNCIESSKSSILDLLLARYSANVNAERVFNSIRMKPIHLAAILGNVEITKTLLRYGAQVNVYNGQGHHPLQIAAEKNHTELVKLLVNEGAYISRPFSCDGKWEYPVHMAITKHNWDMFEILLKKGASINSVNSNNETCIHYAIKYQEFTILEKLCQRGADINLGSPIHLAIKLNSFNMAKTLLDYGATCLLKARNETILHELTLIHRSDRNSHLDVHQHVYREIIKCCRHQINFQQQDGITPLNLAAITGDEEIAMLYLEYGADINKPCYKNLTPLHYAVGPEKSINVAMRLIEAGACIDVVKSCGGCSTVQTVAPDTLLERLVMYSAEETSPTKLLLLERLLEKDCIVNHRNARGYSVLESHVMFTYNTLQSSRLGNLNKPLRERMLPHKQMLARLVSAGAQISNDKTSNTVRTIMSFLEKKSLFFTVTWCNDLPTSRFLIDVGLDLQNESWIFLHGKTPELEEYLKEVRQRSRRPLRLAIQCRNFIRHLILSANGNRDVVKSINQLVLPSFISCYLKLEKEIQCYLNSEE